MLLEVMDGKIIETLPSKSNPMNLGKLCIKGWNAHEFVHSPKRLTKPLMRKDGELREVSWDEALDFTAGRLREIKETHGPDTVTFLTSAKCTNEENYLLQKFCRAGFGVNNVDHCARL
jgi:formate dehydrogenase alpha subunit